MITFRLKYTIIFLSIICLGACSAPIGDPTDSTQLLPDLSTGHLALQSTAPSQHSELWGQAGENWSPSSRLPDYSFAGYHMGEDSIPSPAVKKNVKTDYGAVGDGQNDDTQAFKNAINGTNNGTLYIPAGTYKISDVLRITKSNLVLRGAGRGQTVIKIPNTLTDALGDDNGWAWSGGFIWLDGRENGNKITSVNASANRGDKTIRVSSTSGISVGQMVRLVMTNPDDGSLARHLLNGQYDGGSRAHGRELVNFATRITAVGSGTITLERPIRSDIELNWDPEIHSLNPSIREVGIESLSFEFKEVRATSHLNEPGSNAIQVEGTKDCWIRNVGFRNADSGVTFDHSRFCTVKDVLFTAYSGRINSGGYGGHHGLHVRKASDLLFTNFEFQTKFRHDLTVSSYASGNVFSNGTSLGQLAMDHHRLVPYENLFSNIRVGDENNLWASGGGSNIGPHAAARNTYWNIRSTDNANIDIPYASFGPALNFIGIKTNDSAASGWWLEPLIDGHQMQPADIHLAQLSARLNGSLPTDPDPDTDPPDDPPTDPDPDTDPPADPDPDPDPPTGAVSLVGPYQSSALWPNQVINPALQGHVTLTFDTVPNGNALNAVTGFSLGEADYFSDLGVILRFNTAGKFDVRNGNTYSKQNTLRYSAGTTYHVKMIIDFSTHKYSVYVTPEGSAEVTLAENFAFRSQQSTTDSFDHLALWAANGSHSVSNLVVVLPQDPGTDPPADPDPNTPAVTLVSYAGTAPEGAEIGTATRGELYYTDRNYVLEALPTAYEGGVLVRYANDDKRNSSSDFIQLQANQDVTVVIAYDSRTSFVPSWLSGWTATGEVITGKEVSLGNGLTNFKVYKKTYSSGSTITLGGNQSSGGRANTAYILIVK